MITCCSVQDTSVCEASGCGAGSAVCSVGSIQCTDCYADGFKRPASDVVGSCVGKLVILISDEVCRDSSHDLT